MKVLKNNKIVARKKTVKRYLMFLLGLLIYASTYNLFLLKYDIVAGGLSGIAIITKSFIDPSYFILICSLLLLILSYFLLGKEKTAGSVLGSILYPVFVKLTSHIGDIINIKTNDMLLISIFSGVLLGLALGLIFKNGFTTGGSDIINEIISKYFKKSIGASMLVVDGIIIMFGGLSFGWVNVMYAIIIVYLLSFIADKVILGISNSKAFYIVTDKEEEVRKFILEKINHGVTVIDAKGGYSGDKEHVLLCVVPTNNFFHLQEGIKAIDKDAFFVITDSYEVVGGE